MIESSLDSLLDEMADRIAARLHARQHDVAPGMIEQVSSPLGRRRHCAAVRRRVAEGKPGASIVGRRYLLSTEALQDELARLSGAKVAAPSGSSGGDVREELRRELSLLRGAK